MRMNYQAAAPDVMTAMIGLEILFGTAEPPRGWRRQAADGAGQDPRLADQRVRLLSRHAHQGRPCPGRNRAAHLCPECVARNPVLQRPRACRPGLPRPTPCCPRVCSQQRFEEVRGQLPEAQLANLTLAIATINAWNRFGGLFAPVPGSYQPD